MTATSPHDETGPVAPTTEVLPGRLVLVVGPSGAGKDTLIEVARRRLDGDPRFVFPRRVITRPSSAAEDNVAADAAGFDAVAARGGFALVWRAHGHAYGIPATIEADLARGVTVVVNVSRGIVAEARRRWPDVTVIEVTAPAEILAGRIAARGRASDAASDDRLRRRPAGEIGCEVTIDNGGDLETAVRAFLRAVVAA